MISLLALLLTCFTWLLYSILLAFEACLLHIFGLHLWCYTQLHKIFFLTSWLICVLYYFWFCQGTSVLSPIIPFSLVVIPAFIICQKSPDHIFENHPALYILAFGMVAAKVTNRLVVWYFVLFIIPYQGN